MDIIFIRHEVAEAGRENSPDRERRLTQEGQQRSHAAVIKLADHLKQATKKQKPHIWSSPALRAQETALPLIDALESSPAELKDFIYTGEFEKLAAALADLTQAVETLLVIGHEPTLSSWIHKLTGEMVKMKKGDMASVKLTQAEGQTLAGTYQGKI